VVPYHESTATTVTYNKKKEKKEKVPLVIPPVRTGSVVLKYVMGTKKGKKGWYRQRGGNGVAFRLRKRV